MNPERIPGIILFAAIALGIILYWWLKPKGVELDEFEDKIS